jgi:hypothetical protein
MANLIATRRIATPPCISPANCRLPIDRLISPLKGKPISFTYSVQIEHGLGRSNEFEGKMTIDAIKTAIADGFTYQLVFDISASTGDNIHKNMDMAHDGLMDAILCHIGGEISKCMGPDQIAELGIITHSDDFQVSKQAQFILTAQIQSRQEK